MQRGSHFCLVDEADSILIDEARTPLIIGSLGDKAIEKIVTMYRWAAQMVDKFDEDEHFEYDEESGQDHRCDERALREDRDARERVPEPQRDQVDRKGGVDECVED